jgi:TRAP-type C4-dicarboxylate transport system permease small subunit
MTDAVRGGDLVDRAITVGQAVAGLLSIYLMVSVVIGVIARGIGTPQAWVFELAGPALLALTVFAAAAVARDDGHVRLTLLDEFLPDKRLRQLSRVATFIELAVIALLLYATANQWLADYGSGVYAQGFLRIERWKLTAQVPLGLTLYLLFLLKSLIRGRETARVIDQELEAAGPDIIDTETR